ncbi:MAG: homocysteine S-methyltransferase [Sporolactobacillus laevolacticus]|jgi:homocysteine S-methyltransferase|nr:homocysteine S-methyltransferase [Sporolactobacillus laevolacticus]
MKKQRIRDILNRFRPIILDGAIATEIEKQGISINSKLWSAVAIREHPDSMKKVHLDYFRAGADVATTNTYQATIPGFQQCGYTKREAEELIEKAVTIAVKARAEFWDSLSPEQQKIRPFPLIAGSIGPYGAYLADGSEYTGNYSLSDAEYKVFHLSRMQIVKHAGADVFAFETMPNFQETKALVKILEDEFPDDEAWLSFSLGDEQHLCDGTPLLDAVAYFNTSPQIAAIGVNCIATAMIQPAIELIKQVTDKPILVYPNSGEIYDPATKTWLDSETRQDFGSASKAWFHTGASLIGGCCRTTPEEIRQIAQWARSEKR